MEPWNYVSEGKGFESDERISPNNSLLRNKNALFGWQLRTTPCSFGNNLLTSGGQQAVVDNQGFGELGFPGMIGKQLDNSMNEVFSGQFGGGRVYNQIMAMPNAFSAEDHHGYSVSPRLSTSMVDSNSRVSTLFDLNLGRLPEQNDGQNSKFSNGVPIFSSFESSTTAKRVRTSLNSQSAFCQVYGCHKDLNSSKDYHKRHKVCEVHSKTPKVIVNGIEQRFCQQCSRFHLLAEFDEGKRSCRKRLAGHNERRRKPQVGIHSGRPGRLLHSFDDSDQGYQLGTTSFICQEILPSGLLYPEKYEANDWCRHVKVEDGTNYRHLSTFPVTNGHLHSDSLFPEDVEKQYFHHFNDNGAQTATGNFFMENTVQYTHDNIGGGGPTPSSDSFFHNSSLRSEEYNVFDAATTVEGLSRIPDPTGTCAHSLLSSQSQNSSSQQPAGTPMVRPLIMPSSHSRYGMGLFAEKFIGIRPQHSLGGDSNKIPLSEMNSTEENDDHLGPVLISDTADAVNFDGIFQEFDIWNSNDRHSSDQNGPDLLQLSSQLERVGEHQRQSMQVKQENDSSCLRIF